MRAGWSWVEFTHKLVFHLLSFDCFYFFWMDLPVLPVLPVLKRMQSLVRSFRYLIMSYISFYHIFFYILITINQIFCFRKITLYLGLCTTHACMLHIKWRSKNYPCRRIMFIFFASFVINANLTKMDLQQKMKKPNIDYPVCNYMYIFRSTFINRVHFLMK